MPEMSNAFTPAQSGAGNLNSRNGPNAAPPPIL